MHYLVTSLFLALMWMLLSGHVEALMLAAGVLSVVLVVALVRRMDRIDRQPTSLNPSIALLAYLAWLLRCVVRANLYLIRRLWHPGLPIQPTWARLDTRVASPLAKTLYANSITLTPGTLTTDVGDDHFMIHALSTEEIEELRDGEMERRILRLGL